MIADMQTRRPAVKRFRTLTYPRLTRIMMASLCVAMGFGVSVDLYAQTSGVPTSMQPADPLPAELTFFTPERLLRFGTAAEAERCRDELRRFIWPEGLPTASAIPIELVQHVHGYDRTAIAAGVNSVLGTYCQSIDVLLANNSTFDLATAIVLLRPTQQHASAMPNRDKAAVNACPPLVLIHQGHQGGLSDGISGVAETALRRGMYVMIFQMPMIGWNTDKNVMLRTQSSNAQLVTVRNHDDLFARFQAYGYAPGIPLQLFLDPVVQGLNYVEHVFGKPSSVVMVGLSGGGWTTHMAAAVEPRIHVSIPVAGALPMYARRFSRGSAGDSEQVIPALYGEVDTPDSDAVPDSATGVASWLEIFALGGVGAGRKQIQILNYHDPCCFGGNVYKTYDLFLSTSVQQRLGGSWLLHTDTSHRKHVISPHVISTIIDPILSAVSPRKD